MKKLISMTDFVLSRDNSRSNSEEALYEITQYANFLKQPLKLEMFVPCDDDEGDIMNTLSIYDPRSKTGKYYPEEIYKAKEKVLFEDFTVLSEENDVVELECKDIYINYNKEEDLFFLDSWNNDALIMNIECLANLITHTASSIKLTENAIKTFK